MCSALLQCTLQQAAAADSCWLLMHLPSERHALMLESNHARTATLRFPSQMLPRFLLITSNDPVNCNMSEQACCASAHILCRYGEPLHGASLDFEHCVDQQCPHTDSIVAKSIAGCCHSLMPQVRLLRLAKACETGEGLPAAASAVNLRLAMP